MVDELGLKSKLRNKKARGCPRAFWRNEREGRLLPDRVEVGLGRDVDDIVCHDTAAVDGCGEFDGVDGLELFSCGEDVKFTIFGTDPDLAVGDESRAPDAGLGFVFPVLLAGLGVKAMDVPFVFRGVDKAVVHTDGGDGATNLLVVPDHFSIGTEAGDDTNAVAVLGILSSDDVNLVFCDDGGADDFAGTGVGGVLDGLSILHAVVGRVGVVLPEFLEDAEAIFILFRDRIEGVSESVTSAPGNGVLAVERAVCR